MKQRDCQLLSSQKIFRSPLWGTLWSTTRATSTFPVARHMTHKGFFRRNCLLAQTHLLVYGLDTRPNSPEPFVGNYHRFLVL